MANNSNPNDVMDILATGGADLDFRTAPEWHNILEDYGVQSDLVRMICKERNNPAYEPLVYVIKCAIEAELFDR